MTSQDRASSSVNATGTNGKIDTYLTQPGSRTVLEHLRQKLVLVEGGLELMLIAVKSGDPANEIIWRIEEELRQLRS